jgi:hypothetical protein
MSASASLFDAVVEASGLVALIAPFTVSRLLVAAGVSPHEMTAGDLERALPELEKGLAVYLADDELERSLASMRRLADASA